MPDIEIWALSLASAVSLVIFCACALTMLQHGSFGGTAALSAVMTALLWGGGLLHRKTIRCPRPVFSNIDRAAILIALAASLFVAFQKPLQYMWGTRDFGIYIIDAVHISKTGSMQYLSDAELDAQNGELSGFVQQGYPALFSSEADGISESSSRLNPQFLPMYPAALSLGYEIAGFDGLFRVNAFLEFFSLLLFYCLLRRFAKERFALAGLLFLTLNPGQIWAVRNTGSEILTQLLFLFAASLFYAGMQENDRLLAAFSVAAAASSFFCRIDCYLFGIAWCAAAVLMIAYRKSRAGELVLQSVFIAVAAALSLWYGFTFHYHYFWEHWYMKQVLMWLIRGYAAVLVFTLAAAALTGCGKKAVIRRAAPIPRGLAHLAASAAARLRAGRKNRRLLMAFTALTVLYLYFVRPLWIPDFRGDSLREYGWYFCALLLIPAVPGFADLAAAKGKQAEGVLFFAIAGTASVLMYTIDPAIGSDQPWASRRWVPVNFPFIAFLGALGFRTVLCYHIGNRVQLAGRILHAAGAVLLGAVYVCLLWQGRLLDMHPFLTSLDAQYAERADSLSSGELYVTNSKQTASVLRFVYDKKVLLTSLADTPSAEADDEAWQAALRSYLDGHGSLYFLGRPPAVEGIEAEQIDTFVIGGEYTDPVVGAYPTGIQDWSADCSLYRLTLSGKEAGDAMSETGKTEKGTE
jgi:hypothetical protein